MSSIITKKSEDNIINVAENEWIEHVQGFKDVLTTAKAVLKRAKVSAFINADFPITEFVEEFEFLVDNNVEVSIFSFYDLGKIPDGVRVFTHNHKMKINHVCTRLMIAIDEEEIFISDWNSDTGEWRGTRTNNPLMTAVVCEHIHNDIYLMKFRKKYGREVYEEIMISDVFEQKRKEIGVY